MNKISDFIYFDQEKLDSIGFSNQAIIELIDNFSKYLEKTETDICNLQNLDELSEKLPEALHKLRGAMNYLALSGPIKYSELFTTSTKKSKELELTKNLFYVTNETLALLKMKYL